MNKKAFIDDFMPMILAAGSIILLVIGVFVASLILGNEKTNAEKKFSDEKVLNDLLYKYLKSTIEFEGKKTQVADFLTSAKDNDNNNKIKLFRKHAESYFNKKIQDVDEIDAIRLWHIYVIQSTGDRDVIATIDDGDFKDAGYKAGHSNCAYVFSDQSHKSVIILPSTEYGTIAVEFCTLDKDIREIVV